MSLHSAPSPAAAVMPLRSQSPASRNWASLGLPESGWVLMKEQVFCHNCGDPGSGACVGACTAEHALPADGRQAMGTCAQCDPAPCEEACPTLAVTRNGQGIIQVDQELCIGCRFCEEPCPNHAMLYVDPYRTASPDHPLAGYCPGQPTGLLPNTVAKCTFCSARLGLGLMPVCADACPTQSIWVGNLDRDTATNGQQVVRLSELLRHHRFEMMGPGRRVLALI
ncbi:MAG TPA: 4Fe-4S binding protein [Symbiobacteriaceae bacterium]|nr:4Fe-4S binding protein [Symbiobacteriaceae bacterium]